MPQRGCAALCRITPSHGQLLARFQRVYGLVLRPVIFERPANVGQKADDGEIAEEDGQADYPLDEIAYEIRLDPRVEGADDEKRHHEEERDSEHETQSERGPDKSAALRLSRFIAVGVVTVRGRGLGGLDRDFGGKGEGLHSEQQNVPHGSRAAQYRHPPESAGRVCPA